MAGIRRSVVFSIADKYVSQILSILTTIVMARILTPAETGLFLVANSVILIAENIREFGTGTYIIQEVRPSRALIRCAFTITMLMSLLIGAGVVLASGPTASFYGQPELQNLLLVASISFLIMPFAAPTVALLRRDMAFKSLACIYIAAAITNTSVTIGMGLLGFGAVSYIWGYVIACGLIVVLANVIRPEPWIFRPCLDGYRGMLSFGTTSLAVTATNMGYDLLPRLALGRILGFDAVGLYSRAVTICQLPDRLIVSALQPVVLPAMSEHTRTGGDLKQAYLKGHEFISAFQWPALVLLVLLADPIVRIMLGNQWTEIAPLVRLMALANMALAPAFMTYPLLVSTGRIRDAFLSSFISLPPSIALIVFAAHYGLEVMSGSLLLIAPMQMMVAFTFIRKALDMGWKDMARASITSFLLSIGTGSIPALVVLTSPTGFSLSWLQTAIAIAGGGLGWIAVLLLSNHPAKSEIIKIVHADW